jgi:hypothetical protein
MAFSLFKFVSEGAASKSAKFIIKAVGQVSLAFQVIFGVACFQT